MPDLDPDCGAAWGFLANHVAATDVMDAIRHYDQAIRCGHARSQMHLERAWTRSVVGDSTGARADYDWIVAEAPARSGQVLSARAMLRLFAGDAAGAMSDFDEAVRWQHHGVQESSVLCCGLVRVITGAYADAAAWFGRLCDDSSGPGATTLLWRYIARLRCGVPDDVAGRELRAARPWPTPPITLTNLQHLTGEDLQNVVQADRLALELFAGRASPEQYLLLTGSALAESDAWPRPDLSSPVPRSACEPPRGLLWRSEVMLMLGLWHLIGGDRSAAGLCFSEAARPGEFRPVKFWTTFEPSIDAGSAANAAFTFQVTPLAINAGPAIPDTRLKATGLVCTVPPAPSVSGTRWKKSSPKKYMKPPNPRGRQQLVCGVGMAGSGQKHRRANDPRSPEF